MTILLPRGTILTINGVDWTDHSREALAIEPTRIERSARMVNGTMRKNYVADKIKLSTSWSNLPSLTTRTVDGKLGGKGMKDFYESSTGQGSFSVAVRYDSTVTSYTMNISGFSYDVVHRRPGGDDIVNVSIELEEV